MANQFPAAQGAYQRDTYPDLLNAAIDVIWLRRDEDIEDPLAKYFQTIDADGGSTFVLSTVGSELTRPVKVADDTEELPLAISAPGYDTTLTFELYKLGIQATKLMIDMDRQGMIPSMLGGLMKSFLRQIHAKRAKVLTDGFSNTGPDTVSLFNDSHPHENPEAGTWDNLGTGDISGANLQALHLILRLMENSYGDPDPVQPVELIVHPNDLNAALRLVNSPQEAESSLNAMTQIIKGLKVSDNAYLPDTDSYYLFGNRTGYDKGLFEVYLNRPEIADLEAKTDIPIRKRIRWCGVLGCYASKNVAASAGV